MSILQNLEPEFANVWGAQESIPHGWESIPWIIKRLKNSISAVEIEECRRAEWRPPLTPLCICLQRFQKVLVLEIFSLSIQMAIKYRKLLQSFSEKKLPTYQNLSYLFWWSYTIFQRIQTKYKKNPAYWYAYWVLNKEFAHRSLFQDLKSKAQNAHTPVRMHTIKIPTWHFLPDMHNCIWDGGGA